MWPLHYGQPVRRAWSVFLLNTVVFLTAWHKYESIRPLIMMQYIAACMNQAFMAQVYLKSWIVLDYVCALTLAALAARTTSYPTIVLGLMLNLLQIRAHSYESFVLRVNLWHLFVLCHLRLTSATSSSDASRGT